MYILININKVLVNLYGIKRKEQCVVLLTGVPSILLYIRGVKHGILAVSFIYLLFSPCELSVHWYSFISYAFDLLLHLHKYISKRRSLYSFPVYSTLPLLNHRAASVV